MIDFCKVDSDEVLEFIAARLGNCKPDDLKPCWTNAICRDGKMVAGIVYHSYTELEYGSWVEITVASSTPYWLNRRIIKSILSFPFDEMGVNRLQSVVKRDYDRAKRINERLGFRKEGIIRRAYDGASDVLIYSMLDNEFREGKWS